MATSTRFSPSFLLILLALFNLSQAGSIQHGGVFAHRRLHDRTLTKRANIERRDLGVSSNLPGSWSSKGCYTDDVNSRALSLASYNDNNLMTEETCIAFCNKGGYAYAGVEYASECYCSNFIGVSGSLAAASDCNMACSGNSTELCGGPSRLNVFHNDAITTPAPGPVANAGVGTPSGGFGYIGCYTDAVNSRTLNVNGITLGGPSNMSVLNCATSCGANGYQYAGVEYSGQCYCGNTLQNGGGPAPNGAAGCSMVCNGNNTELCGGPNRLSMYQLGVRSIIAPNWAPMGCYTDNVQARTLSVGMAVLGGGANMTQENCQNACQAANYQYAGVEYSQECYCGNSFSNGGGPAPDGSAGCNMGCKGNGQEVCGGPNRLNVYTFVGGSSTSTSTTASATAAPTAVSTTPASATVAPTPTSTPPVASLPGNWTYRGCYNDGVGGRILSYQFPDSNTLTVEGCAQACLQQGYTVAGLEYSSQCFCGKTLVNGATMASQDSNCAMTCSGNSTEICGGPSLMSIYASGNLTILPVPTVLKTGLPPSWSYQGCLHDNYPNTRVLPYQITNLESNLTVPACIAQCAAFGYTAAGMEYGTQCFCGDDTDRTNLGATYANDGDCSFGCAGDPTTLCGAGLLLTYYTQPKVDIWQYPTGNAAGQYEFLIGGPIIPLLTAQMHNGKVLFVEKHGTGPPNSTGSFELDLSAIGNYSMAWRELSGLQTDVFCSAGLTLPDKAARVINVGGWSLDSTFGVRFYNPDSSPGIAGSGAWQENANEIQLQTGRWYPSAMMMVNGSILVVGGESGSNAPPVPNLEILPKPVGGTLQYCDWLDRTDPNNLYPFLAVLPSGGVLAAYYNEARILDEKSLQTVRTLPNMPGSVVNFLAGRTYPLEGTSMLFPQSYPYTDPLTVLICGGSTPYNGDALDNCVTIQPEVANATWTIERMPSRRVMSSMVALPDGTFLICNGAQQGFAGFGLANNPNLNALLYDPSKPLHQRISVLANTTIARMYHNEATLLQDGRVLISGSDPENQDGKYPQEYRVEIFVPPYLMALNEPLSINSSAQVLYTAGQGNGTNTTSAAASVATAAHYSNSTLTNSTIANSTSTNSSCGARPVFNFLPNNTDWQFGQTYQFRMYCGSVGKVSLMGSAVSTHGNSMGARTLFPQFSCNGNLCQVTAPPNAHVTGGPNWFMMFVMGTNGVPSIAEWVRIGGDPANLGAWPNYSDFTDPGSYPIAGPAQ